MYLKKLKIWNFRKYGSKGTEKIEPGIIVNFHKHFNLLIGENDAGKTSILDAIRHTLGTFGSENFRLTEDDFFVDEQGNISNNLQVECIFSDLTDPEAGLLLEWLSFDDCQNYELIVRMTAKKVENSISGSRIEKIIKAGPLNTDVRLETVALELIRTTYLKPLRDAENELRPGLRSRLAQILKNHYAFKNVAEGEQHELEVIVNEANKKIEEYFDRPYIEGKTIKSEIIGYLEYFFNIPTKGDQIYNPNFQVAQGKLNNILRRLSLELDDKVSGLGSLNLLFIATELLLHNERNAGANLTIIEEIEAHLHPQAQLRLIKYLQNNQRELEKEDEQISGQFILSTHSTTLAASTNLEHIILLHNGAAFPMGSQYTNLDKEDYKFLERFLDATKANLFFARGVIFVEGDAENLLLPVLSEVIDRPLHRYGISIVNIGNIAFKRYARIFSRSNNWLEKGMPSLELPVAIITDVDVRPLAHYSESKNDKVCIIKDISDLEKITAKYPDLETEEINSLLGNIFSSNTSLKKGLDEFVDNTGDVKQLFEELKTEINQDIINELRKFNKNILEDKYNSLGDNIKVCIASNWTLEFEIALSELSIYFAEVIHNIRFKHPNSKGNSAKLDLIKDKIHINDNNEDVAYEIYKPLNDKIVSKAIVAQEFAQVINEHKSELREIILKDPYLDYLVKAIYHVTEPAEGEL